MKTKEDILSAEQRKLFEQLVSATFKAEGEARKICIRAGGNDESISAVKILGKTKDEAVGFLRELVTKGLLLEVIDGDTAWYFLNEKPGANWSYQSGELVQALPLKELNRIKGEIVIHEARSFKKISDQLYGDRNAELHVLRIVLAHLVEIGFAEYAKKSDAYQQSAKKLREFAKIWNDPRSYPVNHDLERKLGKKIKVIQKEAQRYRELRNSYPGLHLPSLILRRTVSGNVVAVPEGVLEQLEPFRFNVERFKDAKGFVVTGCQFGANLNQSFWASLLQYEQARGLPLVVMPIKYGPVKTQYQKETGTRYLTSTFPEELNERILLEDYAFPGDEITLNTTRMRPTLERFLTQRICEMGKMTSQIFAAPKLELRHFMRVGRHYPKAVMTTGACHYAQYQVDNLGQQDRTGEVAMEEHTFAAIVVEFDKGNSFHFRQLLANKKGEFYDINPVLGGADYFTPNGVEHHPDGVDSIVTGDWHNQKTAKDVREGTFGRGGMVDALRPKRVIIHDFVDGDSVNPYQKHEASRRTFMGPRQWDSLRCELEMAKKELDWIRELHQEIEIYAVASNHPEFITWYIEELEWTKSDLNRAIGAELHLMMVADLEQRNPEKVDARATDPVVLWLRKHCPTIRSLERQHPLLLPPGVKDQILVSMHGDVGMRGGETRSTGSFRQMNMRVTMGHNHSSEIDGPVWRVGTSTPRMQFYIKSPATNWTNTHQVIFKNSQRQNVNFVLGKWFGQRQWAAAESEKEKSEK